MRVFEEIFIKNITNQFFDQREFKRIIIQDIPSFVQQMIYEFLLGQKDLNQIFLFTNVKGASSKKVLVAKNKEDLLAKRNDYNISQIAIISGIILDRSNESSVTVINDLRKDKWRWINSSFGTSFINTLTTVDETQKELITKVLLTIGKKYNNGIERQWELLVYLFEMDRSFLAENEYLNYVLGVPKVGINRNLGYSLAIFDEELNQDNQKVKKTIVSEIERLGLYGFQNYVLGSINFIKENSNSTEYSVLISELMELGIDVNNPDDLANVYKDAVNSFFDDLTNKSINPLEICNSPIFYFNAAAQKGLQSWWRKLTSNFWTYIFEESNLPNEVIQVKVMNLEGLFNDKIKNLSLTSSHEKGKIDFQINNFASFKRLEMRINQQIFPIDSEYISYTIDQYTSKPYSFSFIADDAKKNTLKVLPIDRFACGIIPFLANNDSISYLPYKKDSYWISELEISTRGQNKLILLIEESTILNNQYLEDIEDGNHILLQHNNEIQIPGIVPYECFFWIEGDLTEKTYKLKFSGPIKTEILDIRLTITRDEQDEVSSVYRRLVKEHLTREKSNVKVVFKEDYLDLFESWIISAPERSHRPVYLSIEQIEKQINSELYVELNGWHSLVQGITAKKFFTVDYNPSAELIDSRKSLFEFIKNTVIGPLGFSTPLRNIDFVQLGDEFEKLIIEYLFSYEKAIQNQPNESIWFDLHPIIDDRGKSIDIITSNDIIGLIVSPYHPLRLYWQLRAQQELSRGLEKKNNYRYNPAASALDPSIVPDMLNIFMRSAIGESVGIRFISMTNDSDYWGILLKGEGQSSFLNLNDSLELFWSKLGIRIEGLNQGLFPSQIERSLKDVSKLMVSKDKLKVTLQGNTRGYEEEGIFNWLKKVTGTIEEPENTYLQEYVWASIREKSIEVYDTRPLHVQPNNYVLLDEYSQVNQNIKWFDSNSSNSNPGITDLSILCNLGLSNIEMVDSKEQSSPAVGPLLYKHRLIKVIDEGTQVPLKEQRSTNCVVYSSEQPDSIFMKAINILEGGGSNSKTCIALSPSIDLLSKALNSSHLSVVSSSLVSPATFSLIAQRNRLNELYLWDFELPSFNNTSNTKNGYYLLAHPKLGTETSAIKSSFSKYLELFPAYSGLTKTEQDSTCNSLLTEYISKGLPSLKKLVYGGNAFRGEIGNIIAIRILQGVNDDPGILPILSGDDNINLVIPIDPFQDIIEKMPKEEDDDRSRPDLLIITYKKCSPGAEIKITPVEIKFRTNQDSNWKDHIIQATKFSKFLSKIYTLGNEAVLWKVAFASIVGRMIEYGLNLCAAQFKGSKKFDKVYELGFSLLNDLMNPGQNVKITFDADGRLIYINAGQNYEDLDFKEEIENYKLYLNNSEAERILFSQNSIQELIQQHAFLNEGWRFIQHCSNSSTKSEESRMKESSPEVKTVNQEVDSKNKENEELISETATENLMNIMNSFNSLEYLKSYPEGLKIVVGNTKNNVGEKTYYYNPGSTTVNQLNIGIIGDLGTGKTQLLKNIVYSMATNADANRGKAPKFLILDTKRDYDGTGGELDKLFIDKIGAEVLIPYKLKLNLFDIKNNSELNPALTKAKFFIDVLTKIYGGIGPVQKDQLLEAVLSAYKKRGYESGSNYDSFISPTLKEVRDEYRVLVGQTDAPLAIMNTLIHEELFEEDPTKTISFNLLFDKCLVVALGKISSSHDSLKLMMVIFLKLYQDYMLNIEKSPYLGTNPSLRKVDSFVLIDEAKLIMDYGFPVLEDLLRKGREFGVGVILSTQYLSDFTGGKLDYKEPLSTWFIHKVPNLSVKELKSIGITDATETMVTQIQTLQKHYCLYKTVEVNGKIIRGTPLYEYLA